MLNYNKHFPLSPKGFIKRKSTYSFSMDEFIDMIEFVPETIVCNDGHGQTTNLNKQYDEKGINLSYTVDAGNNSHRDYPLTIPRFIAKNERTFEVLGLLQAEMGKTMNGNLSFSNHEPEIINRVMDWFEKELKLSKNLWRWSIKVNIQEPTDLDYKQQIEKKIVDYWCEKSPINIYSSFPKIATYVKKSRHTAAYDYGTLVLEYRKNLFSQVVKNLVKKITYETILTSDATFVRGFMRGIIAGEGCVDYAPKWGHNTVHISATEPEEREIYKKLLSRLNIELKIYANYKETVISGKSNLLEIAKQELMRLSPEKQERFTLMMQNYSGKRSVWKVGKEQIDIMRKLHNEGMKGREIAAHLDLHEGTVYKLLKKI